MKLRDIDPHSEAEIALVAERMRATLVEVEGEAQGGGMYTRGWLADRVRWHLDPAQTLARVVLGLDDDGEIVGHTMFRIERAGDGSPFGLVTTTYVTPEARRLGFAAAFLQEAERWFHAQHMPLAATWTSSTNTPLIALYQRHGFAEDQRGPNELTGTMMVRLAKPLR